MANNGERFTRRVDGGIVVPYLVFVPLNPGWTIQDAGHRAKVDFGDVFINGQDLTDDSEVTAMRAVVFAAAAHDDAHEEYARVKKIDADKGALQIYAEDPAKRPNIPARRECQLTIRRMGLLFGFATELFLATYHGRQMDALVLRHLSKFALPYVRTDDEEPGDEETPSDVKAVERRASVSIPSTAKVVCGLDSLSVGVAIRNVSAIYEGSCDASLELGDAVIDGKALKDPALREAFTALLAAVVAAKQGDCGDETAENQDVIMDIRNEYTVLVSAYVFLSLYKGDRSIMVKAAKHLASLASHCLRPVRDTLVL